MALAVFEDEFDLHHASSPEWRAISDLFNNAIHRSKSSYLRARHAPTHDPEPGSAGLAGGLRLRPQRALVETMMGRYKAIIGPRLRARDWRGQRTEAAVAVAVLNRMLGAARPNSVRTSTLAA